MTKFVRPKTPAECLELQSEIPTMTSTTLNHWLVHVIPKEISVTSKHDTMRFSLLAVKEALEIQDRANKKLNKYKTKGKQHETD